MIMTQAKQRNQIKLHEIISGFRIMVTKVLQSYVCITYISKNYIAILSLQSMQLAACVNVSCFDSSSMINRTKSN